MRIFDGYWVLAREAEYEFGLAPGTLAERGYETTLDVGGQLLVASKHLAELRREAFDASQRARRARAVADGVYQHLTLGEVAVYTSTGRLPAHRSVISTPLNPGQTMPSGAITQRPHQLEEDE